MSLLFELDRMERILNDVKEYIRPMSIPIEDYKVFHAGPEKTDGAVCSTDDWESCKIQEPWILLDSHRWYRTEIVIPEEFEGKYVVLRITTGREGQWDATNPQMLCYVDGKIRQGADVNHREIEIAKCAKAGDTCAIALLAYSGTVAGDLILHTYLDVKDDVVEKFYYDFLIPLDSAKVLAECDAENYRRILKKLSPAADALDLRKPGSERFYQSVEKAEEILKEQFYTEIKEDVPAVYAIGHTHIDIAWLWTVQQTREKVLRSFSTVLELMDRYPDYKFMSSQPILYQFVKEQEPEMYERIKERVREGRWEADGGMWLESDCNLPGGESLVRQIIKGERFFLEEFGKRSKSLWLPDVFGYSAAIPQILKKCGIPYFMTTKIAWNQFNQLPNDTFLWKGIDGSRVFVFMPTTCDYVRSMGENISFSDRRNATTYTGIINPNMTLGTYKRFQNRDLTEDTLMLYGYGDGGGGPTAEMLEHAERLKYGIPGLPKIVLEEEETYFDKIYAEIADKKEMPTWDGELYFEYHRGTLTSMAKNKRDNRRNELLYEQLETLSSMSGILGNAYPKETIEKGWEVLLLNQFHDILPGSAIEEVYDVTDQEYQSISEAGVKERDTVLHALAEAKGKTVGTDGKTVWVFNSQGFERNAVVTFDTDERYQFAEASDGQKLPIQYSRDGKAMFLAQKVPSLGMKAYRLIGKEEAEAAKGWNGVFENEFYQVQFNEKMQMISLIEKTGGQEMIKENRVGNELVTYEDRPMNWDNWDIDEYYKKKPYEADEVSVPKLLEDGPVRTVLEITHKFSDSEVTQEIILYKGLPRIDFKTKADWREHNVLLRVNFPADVNAVKASYEIQFGNVERETTANHSWDSAKFEVCAHKWADLSDNGAGLSLLNDCKYGYSIRDGEMGLTLIKAGTYPNANADIGEHAFTYSIYPHSGRWMEAETVEMAYDLNVPLQAVVAEGYAVCEGGRDEWSLLTTDHKNCFVEMIKQAEDGSGYILRVYENQNKRTNARYHFGIAPKAVWECDLLEQNLHGIDVDDGTFTDCIKPYEIKTYRLIF